MKLIKQLRHNCLLTCVEIPLENLFFMPSHQESKITWLLVSLKDACLQGWGEISLYPLQKQTPLGKRFSLKKPLQSSSAGYFRFLFKSANQRNRRKAKLQDLNCEGGNSKNKNKTKQSSSQYMQLNTVNNKCIYYFLNLQSLSTNYT